MDLRGLGAESLAGARQRPAHRRFPAAARRPQQLHRHLEHSGRHDRQGRSAVGQRVGDLRLRRHRRRREFRAQERRRGRGRQLPLRHADRGRRRRVASAVVVGRPVARPASTRCSGSSCSTRGRCGHSIARSRIRPPTIPTTDEPIARRDFLRIEPNEEVYIDPGQATCDSLSGLNKGTIGWGTRPGWGPYDDDLEDYGPGHFCGSEESIGYGTILNSRRGATGFASLNYDLSDTTTLFADVLDRREQGEDVQGRAVLELHGRERQRRRHVLQRPGRRPRQLVPPVHARGNGRARTRHDPQRSDARSRSRPASRARSATTGNTRPISTTASTRSR